MPNCVLVVCVRNRKLWMAAVASPPLTLTVDAGALAAPKSALLGLIHREWTSSAPVIVPFWVYPPTMNSSSAVVYWRNPDELPASACQEMVGVPDWLATPTL